MGLTDNSDLYLAIHETGINLVLKHVMRQRPSLFNYGSEAIAADGSLLCSLPDVDPAVTQGHNPLSAVVSLPATLDLHALAPHPSDGSLTLPDLTHVPFPPLDFCAEVANVAVDFYPGSMTLPGSLSPLPPQMLAVHFDLTAGLRRAPGIGIPAAPLSCFTVSVYAESGIVGKTDGTGEVSLKPVPGGIQFSGIGPNGLIDSLNLLIDRFIKQPGNIRTDGYLLPFKALLSIPQTGPNAGRVEIIPTLALSQNLPHNPAIQDDELQVWIDVNMQLQTGTIPVGDVGTVHVSTAPITPAPELELALSEALAGGILPVAPGTVSAAAAQKPPYDWTGPIPDAPPGPDHVTASIAGAWVDRQLDLVKQHFQFASTKHLELNQAGGKILFDYDVLLHLKSGKITRTNAGSIGLMDADIAWDRMNFVLAFCIPQQCVTVPGLGKYCVFGGTPAHPDIRIPIDLRNYLTSEIEVAGTPAIRYGKNTSRPAGMTDRQAVANKLANKWGVFVHPDKVHVEPIDVDDTIDNVIDEAVADAIAAATANAPAWAAGLLAALLGNAKQLIEKILGLPDQLNGWLSQKIGVDLNLITDLETALAQHFLTFPLFTFDDPLTIMPEDTNPNKPLIPVLLPLRDLKIKIDAQELTLQGKVGPVQ